MSTGTDRPDALAVAGPPEVPAPTGRPAPHRVAVSWWADRLAWLGPVLLTGAIVGHRMTAPQPWRDEFATWSAATRTLEQLWRLVGTIDLVALPYYLLMHAWIGVFGDSVFALRLPSVLAMTAAAGVVTLLGRSLYGTGAGLLGGLLFAVLPSVTRYGQEARGYAFATLFAALATLLLVYALQRPRPYRWLGYGIAVALLGSAHLVGLLLLAGHAVAVGIAARRDGTGRLLWWSATVATAGLGLAPLALLSAGQRRTQLDWLTAAEWRELATAPEQLFGSGVAGGAIIALAAVGVRAGSGAAWPGWLLWSSAVLPVAALFAVDQLVAPIFVSRYLLVVVPLLCVLAGAGLAGKGTAGTGTAGTGTAGTGTAGVRLLPAVVALLAVGLTGLPQHEAVRRSHEAPGAPLYDYLRVADFLRAHQRPGDGIVYAPRDGWHLSDVAMRYHLGDRVPRDVLLDRDAVRRGSLWATECPDPAACLAGTARVWVLSGDDLITGARARALDGTTGAARAALGAYVRVDEWRLSEFTLALYLRRPV